MMERAPYLRPLIAIRKNNRLRSGFYLQHCDILIQV
jgi:hypothetical protein